jgi:AhpD family alkylhydroperoxidase
MSGVQTGVFAAWPDGLNAMLAVDAVCDASGLSPRLLELVRLWCSVLNDCAFCVAMHRRKAVAEGVEDGLINALVARQDLHEFGGRERVALDYATVLTKLSADGDAKAGLIGYFDPQQVIVLSYAIAQINAWNRLARTNDV